MRQYVRVLAWMPLLMLAGCPNNKTAAPGTSPAQMTAPALAAKQTAALAPVAPPAPAPQANENPADAAKVQQLITTAEASYRSGVDNYRANHLDAARIDFDAAVDVMLTSGMDLKNDPQLADEFDHLLNAVNSLEMAALKQGNGFSPKLEDAPLDEAANEVTFPPNAELTAKVAAELKTTQSDFPLVINNYVAGYISYFTNSPAGHAHLLRSLERAGKYKDMIQKNLRDQGVPQDLIYLAVAESGFQPQALNARSGAGGMWQFMPFQGAYGLARNGYVDERFDPEKSSIAYAKYMKSLYNQFGDWYLAMAAYDWGPGYVQRAVMKTGYADFWELYRRGVLPGETKNYVPGIIAAIIMAKNPAQYGLDKLVPDAPVLSDTVTVNYAIDLPLVADVTNVSLSEIVALNPSLLRMTTPANLPFDLHIPPGTKDVFEARLKAIPEEKRDTWRFHLVRGRETLDEIASSLHARVSDIVAANGMQPGETVDVDDELVIPVTVVASAGHPQRYKVRRGDTLVTVADRFNVSVEDLRGWNHLSARTVKAGQMLNVSEPVRSAPTMRSRRAASRRRGSQRTTARGVSSRVGAHPAARGSTHASTSAATHTSAKSTGKKQTRPSPSSATKNTKRSTTSSRASESKPKHKAAR
jgi:membrane-bound lytic murein transglycosylase D